MTAFEYFELAFLVGGYTITLLLLPRVVLARRESAATLSWILTLIFFPILGAVFYWLFGERRLKRFVKKRRRAISELERSARVERGGASEAADHPDGDLISTITKLCGSDPTHGNEISQFSDPDAAAETMLKIIDGAKDHIHFEVYQFKNDESGTAFRDHLVQAAKRGVRVKLLLDDVGSLWTPKSFFNVLRDAGAQIATFLPVTPLRGMYHANLRNHRKILIVDGIVAFTGGLNVGDEYGGPRKRRFGPWRDTHLMMRGPAVANFQDVFQEDWFFVTKKELDGNCYPLLKNEGGEMVHVVASGPDSDWESIHHAIFTMITKARDHIYLTTPYFIPDRSLLVALQTAALRGLDVRLLLPARSDHAIVCAAGRFHYEELLRAGVRIFEYTNGMLHTKTVEVDGRYSTIGSANLDLRSFRLNFEMNIVAYGERTAKELNTTFKNDLLRAREVSASVVGRWTRLQRFGIASARLLEGIL